MFVRSFCMLVSLKKSIFSVTLLTATMVMAAPKPLKVWIMPNGASPKEKLEQRLEQFTQKTGISTEIRVLDWGEAWNSITQALSGEQEAPDVLQLGTTWIPYFASRQEIKPLNDWLTPEEINRFVPVSWGTTHIDGDSVIYSLPWFIDIRAVLANKRILKENGITKESASTYEGFRNAIKKINAAKRIQADGSQVQGYAFPGKSDWNIPHNFAPWIWSNGGDFIEKGADGKWHANILSRQSLQGISNYLNFVLDSLVQTDDLQKNTAQIAQRFNNGELAFIINTSEIIMQTRIHGNQGGLSNAQIGQDSVIVLPIPKGSAGSVSFIGGSNLAIPAKNTRKEARDLLFFLVNDENLDAYTKQIGLLPTSKKVLETWSQDEDYRELVNALATGKTYTAIPEWGDLEQQFVLMFSTIWEQVEVPSLFSEEKIYDIMKQYTEAINAKLGASSDSIMTKEEFLKIWNELNGKAVVANDETSDEAVSSNFKKAPIIFIIMLILGFAFNYRRKSKK